MADVPPNNDAEPPAPVVPAPTVTPMAPPLPPDEAPVVIAMPPLAPALELPVTSDREPLMPEGPLSAELIVTAPLVETVGFPLRI